MCVETRNVCTNPNPVAVISSSRKYIYSISNTNRTPLLRLKVKDKNKGQKDEVMHVEDLVVCGPLTDLRPGIM